MTKFLLRSWHFGAGISIGCVVLSALYGEPVFAQGGHIPGEPTATPKDVGMSSERIERVRRHIRSLIDDSLIAGAVGLIARRGEIVFHEAFGTQVSWSAGRGGSGSDAKKGVPAFKTAEERAFVRVGVESGREIAKQRDHNLDSDG